MAQQPIDLETRKETQGPPESYYVPATDIYETPDELVLVAEMPGVEAEGLDLTVADNLLTLRGRPAGEAPEGEALLEEYAPGEYYRTFQLPADFDAGKVSASLKQGVLTLKLPKSERMKPRRIEIKSE